MGDNINVSKLILTEYLESLIFEEGWSGVSNLSVTGEPFIKIVSRGDTKEDAVEQFKEDLKKYSEGKEGTIYWRVYPHIESVNINDCYQVYSRLIISSMPMITRKKAYNKE